MKQFKSLYVNAEEGIVEVNGEPIKNVTAFSASFEDGEYGLVVSRDDMYTSEKSVLKWTPQSCKYTIGKTRTDSSQE